MTEQTIELANSIHQASKVSLWNLMHLNLKELGYKPKPICEYTGINKNSLRGLMYQWSVQKPAPSHALEITIQQLLNYFSFLALVDKTNKNYLLTKIDELMSSLRDLEDSISGSLTEADLEQKITSIKESLPTTGGVYLSPQEEIFSHDEEAEKRLEEDTEDDNDYAGNENELEKESEEPVSNPFDDELDASVKREQEEEYRNDHNNEFEEEQELEEPENPFKEDSTSPFNEPEPELEPAKKTIKKRKKHRKH